MHDSEDLPMMGKYVEVAVAGRDVLRFETVHASVIGLYPIGFANSLTAKGNAV